MTIRVLHVQLQPNGMDCGLFALANITASLVGLDLSVINFNGEVMRRHMIECFERGDPRPFPTNGKTNRSPSVLGTFVVKLYCTCRLHDDGSLMVKCSKCRKWFHKNCTVLETIVIQRLPKLIGIVKVAHFK